MNQTSAEARQRALLILQVQAGLITATAAAQQLGLARKTYSQWERRGLAAILASQVQHSPGRPLKMTDPEKEGLRRRVAELEQKLSQLAQVKELRQVASWSRERRAGRWWWAKGGGGPAGSGVDWQTRGSVSRG